MAQVYADEQITIEAYPALGPLANNCYVMRATSGNDADGGEGGVTIVDAPEGIEPVLADLAGSHIERIVVTHSHFDHWGGFDQLRERTSAPVFVGADETKIDVKHEALPLSDGETFNVGKAQVQVIATPGHTPGSICLLANGALLTGDTLFPGGPGRTASNDDLGTIIESIRTRLLTLDGGTLVLPGHGDTSTIEASQREYEVFASKDHPDDLKGDVLWLES